jgi:Tfp pilus assembly protein PilF
MFAVRTRSKCYSRGGIFSYRDIASKVQFNTVHNLGVLYSNQGKLKGAEEMYQRALVGKEKTIGPDHTSTLDTVHNLGSVYSDQGKLKEAEEMYQRGLAGYKKALGPDHGRRQQVMQRFNALSIAK